MIASTASLFRVQTEFSLNSFICSVIGSDVEPPQIVPEEQLEVDVVKAFVTEEEADVVDSELDAVEDDVDVVEVSEEVPVEQSVIPWHLL